MLDGEQLKSLNELRPLKSALDLFLVWGTIISALIICHESYWFVPLMLPVLASRLHALTLLMHDGSHFLLHPNEKVNDVLSNFLCSFPLGLSTEVYRKTHWKHHQFTQTMKDPNYVIMQNEPAWNYPKSEEEIRGLLIKDFLFVGMKDHMKIIKDWQFLPNLKLTSALEKKLFPVFVVTVVSIVYFTGGWREFLILQAGAFLINPLTRIRAMSEHAHFESEGTDKANKMMETPTINAGEWERFFLAPFNTNRHLEHHLYPTVPYYNLEKAHALLEKTAAYKHYCRFELDGYVLGERTAFREILVGEGYPEKKLKVA